MNLDYELAIAEQELIEAKRAAREYLDEGKPTDWYLNFEICIARIMRYEAPNFAFGPKGAPE